MLQNLFFDFHQGSYRKWGSFTRWCFDFDFLNIFIPQNWGFMIQFDLPYFSNGWEKKTTFPRKPWTLAMVLLRDLQIWHLRPTPVTCSASVVSMKDQWKKAMHLLMDFRYAQVEINVILGERLKNQRVALCREVAEFCNDLTVSMADLFSPI